MPIAPYSQAVAIGNVVSVAGQGGVDPSTSKVVAGGIVPETHQTFLNVTHALAAAGATMQDVLHIRVFMADLAEFEEMNPVYGQYVDDPFPARTTVGAQLPLGLRIEVDVLAVLAGS